MMGIFGIGTDLCEIARVEAIWRRHGEAFARRVLGAGEFAVFEARQARLDARGVRYLATRIAAKEAVSKALGLGISSPMTWQACEILNAPDGRPQVALHGELAAWCAQRGLRLHVSLSDEQANALAFAVAEIAAL